MRVRLVVVLIALTSLATIAQRIGAQGLSISDVGVSAVCPKTLKLKFTVSGLSDAALTINGSVAADHGGYAFNQGEVEVIAESGSSKTFVVEKEVLLEINTGGTAMLVMAVGQDGETADHTGDHDYTACVDPTATPTPTITPTPTETPQPTPTRCPGTLEFPDSWWIGHEGPWVRAGQDLWASIGYCGSAGFVWIDLAESGTPIISWGCSACRCDSPSGFGYGPWGEGWYQFWFRARDDCNVEPWNFKNIGKDATFPKVSIDPSGAITTTSQLTLTVTAFDQPLGALVQQPEAFVVLTETSGKELRVVTLTMASLMGAQRLLYEARESGIGQILISKSTEGITEAELITVTNPAQAEVITATVGITETGVHTVTSSACDVAGNCETVPAVVVNFVTPTPTPTPSSTPTPTPTETSTPTSTPSATSTETPTPCLVTLADVQAVAGLWRQPADPPEDRDGDGIITIIDVMWWVNRVGEVCPWERQGGFPRSLAGSRP